MSEDIDTTNFILTHSGVKFEFLDPHPSMVRIEDIAHALSNTIRWGGHSDKPMTVAQHSVNVSRLVMEGGAWAMPGLHALLHDASEAYLPDMPRPIKGHLRDYKLLESIIQSTVYRAFGVQEHHLYREMTHAADDEVLRWEARDLLVDGGRGVIQLPAEPHDTMEVWSAERARTEFLWVFEGLRALVEEAA